MTKRPESVEQLLDELWEKLELEGDFSVQYEDPDFENALCNLIDMEELPVEKAVLHIVCVMINHKHRVKRPSLILIQPVSVRLTLPTAHPPLFRPFCKVLQSGLLLFQFLHWHMM